MKFTARNAVATLLVAAIVVPYVGYLIWDQMPFIQDPRGMAATGLVLGIAAAVVAGRDVVDPGPLHRLAQACGVVALGFGIAALWAETSEALLAAFVVAIVLTWATAEVAAARQEGSTARPLARQR
ncbi:hypothetical protein [Blastococcus sp. VKM Ac-2987]|uniref:hypothetical protein n=1 Tax=Blastococcus sp. VKM Ac-2987 TaxID=3004141 RepID=UPI0022AB7714|nr:hypothetical protein [Blastococcus sp. VKM Ac-2987]MCZ2860634.1 hypothetical protein [Blastococcus sp. VKM Ac-2987]